MRSANLAKLHRIETLRRGMEWAVTCPDAEAGRALFDLASEEMGAELSVVTYAAGQSAEGESAGVD